MAKLGELFRRGVGAPLRAILPKNPWLRILLFAIPILLLAAFLEPVLSLLARGMDLLLRTFEPLLDNPVGRLVLLNVILIVALIILWYLLKDRWRALRSGLLLRNHLQAVGSLVSSTDRARELFRKVAASRAPAPHEYPAASEDAKIKLARLAIAKGEYEGALAWLTRVREKGLPKELRRSLLQLRVQAALAQGEVLGESVERELRESLRKFPDDVPLLAFLRQVLLERGALEEAATMQERLLAQVPSSLRPDETQRLVDDWLRAGEAALEGKDFKRALRLARKAAALDTGPATGCLVGKIRLAEGDLKAAAKEWGATASPEGIAFLADLLDDHPGALTPRELLECSPHEGCVLLVAREYARAGEHARALRAARRVARSLGPLPSVTAILAEVLTLCGQHEEAAQIQEEAVLRLVAPQR